MGFISSFFSLTLCFLLLSHSGDLVGAQRFSRRQSRQGHIRSFQQDECQLDRINAMEPSRRIHSEAGVTELWDQNDQQFRCAGVVAMRHVIQERGMLLPIYVNGPKLVYVVQGNGIQGAMNPGCPETFEFSESQSQGQFRQEGRKTEDDSHQRVRRIRRGDVIALPHGVAHWIYNNGRTPLVLVQIIDLSNQHNQLDQNLRAFFMAGNMEEDISQREKSPEYYTRRETSRRSRGEQRGMSSRNVFSGIDDELLAEAFNVNTDLARRLKGENDNRGIIVMVEGELEVLSPERSRQEEQREREEERRGDYGMSRRSYGGGRYGFGNGIEETFCSQRLKHNIDRPSSSDVFNPQAGRVTNVNSFNLPILRHLRLSVQKGVLYRNAVMAPHWNMNAHSIYYFTEGSGNVQIVDDNGESVFDGQVREGQMLICPQNFVVIKEAREQGMEWVAFKTNDNAKIQQLAGRVSALRAMPEDVVANSYQISREDARRIMFNRQEVTMFTPSMRAPTRRM